MKAFFDEKTGRVWPNAELRTRAKLTREWTPFVKDKFDFRQKLSSHMPLQWSKVRCEHVDLHKNCRVQRRQPHAKL